MKEINLDQSQTQTPTQPQPQPDSQPENKSPLRVVPKRILPQLTNQLLPIAIIIIVLAAGVFSGLIVSSRAKNKATGPKAAFEEEELNQEQKQAFQVVTRDQAEGVLEKNDKFEETAQGQWKLIRPGGESQTAYLTSSFLDLDEYVGKKVKVFGETLGSDKVGWLMDVAKVEIIQ